MSLARDPESWIKRLKKYDLFNSVPLFSLEHAGSQPQQLFSSQSLWLAQLGEILCVAEHPGKSDWGRMSGPSRDQHPDRAAQLRKIADTTDIKAI